MVLLSCLKLLISVLDLLNCNVRPLMVKDRYCFELSTAKDNKKGDKKYIFAVEKEEWRDRWIQAIKTASSYRSNLPAGEGGTDNPIQGVANNTPQYDRSDSISSEASESSTQSGAAASAAVASGKGGGAAAAGSAATAGGGPKAKKAFVKNPKQHKHLVEMSGYLQKKSPAMLKGWQKRYFIMRPSGEIAYYKDVSYQLLVVCYLFR